MGGGCSGDFVGKVAKRILRFWNHLVISHDVGNVSFLVREETAIAARIFGRNSPECLGAVYGVQVANSGCFCAVGGAGYDPQHGERVMHCIWAPSNSVAWSAGTKSRVRFVAVGGISSRENDCG